VRLWRPDNRRFLAAVAVALCLLAASTTPATGATANVRPSLRPGESYGIDVASFQGAVDWAQVKKNAVSFTYIKATQGTSYVNPFFRADWQGAKAAGLSYGAYQFFSLCSAGLDQARSFLAVVPRDRSALPAAVDLELRGNCAARPRASMVAAQLRAFVTAVEAGTHKTVLFYIGRDFAARYRLSMFRTSPQWQSRLRRPTDRHAVVWQPKAVFQIGGIATMVDLDVTTLPALRALR
jgi:lysozyme